MATLQDIRRRIRSVQSTQKITRAMKLVAAAKLRRAQDRILEARPYAFKMAELVRTLVRGLGEDKHPLLVRRDGHRTLYVAITADKGLAGAFNTNVLRRSSELLRAGADGAGSLLAVGRKARDFYRRRPWKMRGDRVGFLDRLTFAQARQLAGELMQAYRDDEGDEVWLVFNEFRSVPRHVEVQLYRALLESAAAEHGARMTAMEAATQNAQEIIGLLSIQYNKARQEKITKDLLDIVGGAEALRTSAGA